VLQLRQDECPAAAEFMAQKVSAGTNVCHKQHSTKLYAVTCIQISTHKAFA
jgi:hypothetical protein